MRKSEWKFHVLPIIAAVGFAAGGIPEYDFSLSICMVQSPPLNESWIPTIVFLVCPWAFVTTCVTVMLFVIYRHVRKTVKTAQRWNFQSDGQNDQQAGTNGAPSPKLWKRSWFKPSKSSQGSGPSTGASNKMETAVFWQCLFFLLAFYVTWPFYFASQFVFTSGSYWFWIAVVFFSPLQGFLNALVYARPRISRYIQQKRQERVKRKQRALTDAANTSQKTSTQVSATEGALSGSEQP